MTFFSYHLCLQNKAEKVFLMWLRHIFDLKDFLA